MASQPANTTIEVFRRVRAQRDDNLHTSIKHRGIGVGFNPLVAVPPGEEILVFETRDDANITGAFRFGFPVTVEARTRPTFEDVQESLFATGDADFPLRLPAYVRDVFIQKPAGQNGEDLHQQVRDASPVPRGLFVQV